MNDQIDRTIFSTLKTLNPRDVVFRTNCEFDERCNRYYLEVWGQKYCVDLNQCEVRPEGAGSETFQGYLYLFILYYLMNSKNLPVSGEWVSEKDIPGGAAFFRGPHTIPADIVTQQCGEDILSFRKACERLGGIPINLADAAYTFQITPILPVAVLYWQGDSDFPSQVKLLFDRTIARHLPLDIIYALAVEICHALGRSFSR